MKIAHGNPRRRTTDDLDYHEGSLRRRRPFFECQKVIIKPMKKQHMEYVALTGRSLDPFLRLRPASGTSLEPPCNFSLLSEKCSWLQPGALFRPCSLPAASLELPCNFSLLGEKCSRLQPGALFRPCSLPGASLELPLELLKKSFS